MYTRTSTIDPAPGGDSVKSAILDLDTDLTGAFAGLNAIDAAKSSTSHNHDTIYASISNVVTNGNAHDHSGGDGAAIDYNTLSGIPAGLLDETSHDALDHTGLTGIPAAYTLPTATTTTLGGVKIDGTSITIASGVISAASSGGVSDGDKGDITVSGSGATWTVDANVITPAKLSRTGTAGQVLTSGGDGADPSYQPVAGGSPYSFDKLSAQSVAFTKTAAATASVKAGTQVMVATALVTYAADTAITMPALTGGTDYAIYACTDGTCRADASFVNPTGYTTGNSRLIGGFHYGLVAAGTTVAGGSFATTGTGMIWTQTDVDNIAGINKFSFWDLKWRSSSNDPSYRGQKGFVYVQEANNWQAIYLCSTDHIANGLSKAGSNIASGTVLPKIPLAFNGNGTTTYAAPTWWDFNEIVRAYGCRMYKESEFNIGAFGVTENQSIDAVGSTYPTTQRNAGYTSKYGIEQASGHHWAWGADASGTTSSAYVANGGRGQSYANSLVRPLLGGVRTSGAYSGSRASVWNNFPGSVYWSFGVRAACDHLCLL